MLKQIIILGVIAYASCVSVDECRFGESYWCQSISTAKKCGAVQHCMSTVWQNQKLVKDNADTCQYCVNIINDVKTFLDNKQTQAEIKQFLMSACKIVPDATLSQECNDAVNQDFDTIIQMVEQAMDPQTVCALIGMCSGLENKVQQPEKVAPADPVILMQKAAAADYCGDCKKFFSDVKAILESPLEEKQLEELIEENLCAQLGGMESTCDQLVEEYVPTLVMILSSEFDPTEVCQAMGFCNSTVDSKVLLKKLVAKAKTSAKPKKQIISDSPSTGCVLCEFVMKEVDSLLMKNSTEEAILKALDQVCSIMPATIVDECTNFVGMYGPAVIMLLSSELSPAEVCSTLGLCKDVTLKDTRDVKDSEMCLLCETVIQYLDSIISTNASEQEIEDALDKVCNFLPKNYQSECDTMVSQYTPVIIQLMKNEITPEELCTAIGLCTSKAIGESVIKPEKANLVGVNKCSYGPAYWCATRENAKECGAEPHCMRHVWN